MRICLSLILAAFVALFSFGVSAQAKPEVAAVKFFCITSDAIEAVRDGLKESDMRAEAVATDYEAKRQCFFLLSAAPVLVGEPMDTFSLADGSLRSLWEGYLPTGRPVYFIGPAAGQGT